MTGGGIAEVIAEEFADEFADEFAEQFAVLVCRRGLQNSLQS